MSMFISNITSTSILVIVGPKYKPAALHAATVSHGEYADGTDRRTDRRPTVTLRLSPDAASL